MTDWTLTKVTRMKRWPADATFSALALSAAPQSTAVNQWCGWIAFQ